MRKHQYTKYMPGSSHILVTSCLVFCHLGCVIFLRSFQLQARMKLPKKRRRVVAVEQPRRNARRMGQSGSTAGGNQRGNGGGGDGAGLHRRMNAIKSGGGHSISHSHTNNSIPNTQGGTYRLPNAPHDKMCKSP